MNSLSYIYTIRGPNGIYVGQTVDVESRWRAHRNLLRNNEHTNPHLQNAWNKYGEVTFEFKVAARCSTEELSTNEQYWIDAYKASGATVYNVVDAGNPPMLGRNHTEETKEKMSIGHMGIKHSDETKMRISKKQTGQKRSEVARSNMSKAQVGHRVSESARKKMSEAKLGKSSNRLGCKHSEETRAKMSLAQKIRWARFHEQS